MPKTRRSIYKFLFILFFFKERPGCLRDEVEDPNFAAKVNLQDGASGRERSFNIVEGEINFGTTRNHETLARIGRS